MEFVRGQMYSREEYIELSISEMRKSRSEHQDRTDPKVGAVLVAPDGTKTDWLNTATGNRGKVQVIDKHQDFGTTCRHIRMRNEAAGRVNSDVYRLCLATDGNWKFAPNASDAPKYDATDTF